MNAIDIDPLTLPSLCLLQRKQLPSICAVYFVLYENEVIYVGKSNALMQRWSTHHRLKELNSLSGEVRIAWLICDNPQFLDQLEKLMIAHFKPWMNRSKVKQPSKDGHPGNTNKDRVTFHNRVDTRIKIEKLIPDMGKSLSMVVRNLVNLGLEVVGLSQKGLTAPRSGNVEKWLASYSSLGTELAVACEAFNLSAPKPGQVAIWLLDKMAFGSNDPQVINEDEKTATNLLQRIRLGKKLQTFSWKQGIEIPLDEEFDVWVGKLYSDAAIAQEFVATCRTLGLQPPEKGKLQEWLQDLVILSSNVSAEESPLASPQGTSYFTDDGLPLGHWQPCLDYLLTLDASPTEDEVHNIAYRFSIDLAHLKKLLSRMRFDKSG